ncbi:MULTISPECIES: peptidylprolyl isomerase [Ralstonia]|jgi:peptidyl-prolyl cis-trans isomerase C|uniref:peptidylprolyl isomerase n=4 Tax=Bacteria TaxID=2 RepID=A0AAD2F184_9RALS|nr:MULTISPECIES: peptidylprolyl isomerase [Ralstonia]EFP65267.1 PPIC-type PPIASE domain protein [Ralstonia pickettii]EGY60671.1 hypothetical protein HMPREF0989_04495 [Ralstonia sp. 5_2_56FAA]MBB0022802.1 peptidylprolyl isomerase [Ralstonia pickettii]MBB0033359.1 peptidylprolyl isomerase [Ralstonia pickettii]MBB0096112.1 peptidylprolyl isomerase [Ralstonia pickettii]
MSMQATSGSATVVRINGVVIDAALIAEEEQHHAGEPEPLAAAACALAIHELLRQRAVALQLISDSDALDDACVDALLERELAVPEPTRADCERYYQNHPARFRRNDIVYASHILFAVTDRAPVALLLQKAQQTLQQVLEAPETFEAVAREVSNCPSAGVGGSLGQLLRGDSVPEFERVLFDSTETGVLPRIVKTRFGFHVVRIEHRVAGDTVPFDAVEAEIAQYLEARVRHKATQQYVSILASQAQVEGVDLGAANGPLVQ